MYRSAVAVAGGTKPRSLSCA